MDQQQRNLIIAVALSAAILFGFEYFTPKRPAPPPQPTQATEQTTAPSTTAPPAPTTPPSPEVRPRADVLAEAPRVAIETPLLRGSLDLKGARIDDLTLTAYHETTDPTSPAIALLAPQGTSDPYFLAFSWVAAAGSSAKVPDDQTLWTASGGNLTPDHPIDLTWDNGAGLHFTQHLSIDPTYMLTVMQSVTNNGGAPVALVDYGLIRRGGKPPESSTVYVHEGPIAVLGGTLHDGGWFLFPDKYNYADVRKSSPIADKTTGGWIGFTDKYWMTSLILPSDEAVKTALTYGEQSKEYQSAFTGPEHQIAPGASVSTTARAFVGAKVYTTLSDYESNLPIPLFSRAIDFGILFLITKPIFLTLDFFDHWLGNFGLAILLLTALIKLLFFPLANKSFRSMAKMKKLAPEMQKLREKFADDKEKLNQETMALYKRVGANPLAGCLPIVIQIPVFISLLKVLYVTIEMRQAPFFGWIHDLSAPDPTSLINLFGLLPFSAMHIAIPVIGSVFAIGAWPLIMGVTMFLQQKLNPPPPDPMQAKMFMLLPIIFTFTLSQFAAGLVIYWSWNNLLTIAQQWTIMRRATT